MLLFDCLRKSLHCPKTVAKAIEILYSDVFVDSTAEGSIEESVISNKVVFVSEVYEINCLDTYRPWT